MKRMIVAAIAAVLTLGAIASVASAGELPLQEPGKLLVGIDPAAKGFTAGKAAGDGTVRNPRGFEIDVAKALANRLGLTPEFRNVPWTSLFKPGPKPYDLAFEQITITAQRDKVIDFSSPYFDANQGIILARGVAAPKRLAELRQLPLCAQAQTTGLDWIKAKLRPAQQPQAYQTLAAAFQALALGRCDAMVMDVPIVTSEKRANPARYGAVAGQVVTKEKYGALFEQGSALRSVINAQIKAMIADGTLARLQKKWFAPYPNIPILR